MPFGQIVIGHPGSGKSTYCHGVQQFFKATNRPCILVNLDPANDSLPYEAQISLQSLITMEDVMREHQLGPNGALLYCMEFLLANVDWLANQLKEELRISPVSVIVIDFPGQIELFTHSDTVTKITSLLSQKLDVHWCAVQLVDSLHCLDSFKFISCVLVSLQSMLRLNCPFVNVLSKMDLMPKDESGLILSVCALMQSAVTDFNIDYYTDVQDLSRLLLKSPHSRRVDDFSKKFQSLTRSLVDLIEDFSLVSFYPLEVQDKESMYGLLKLVDRANGFAFNADSANDSILEVAQSADSLFQLEKYL